MSESLLLVCGVDEAGRGPLAGPVYAACVILDPARKIRGLADSKVLAPERREVLAERIKDRALAYAIASASVEEIDEINILQASLLAMARAVAALGMTPHEVLVDGNQLPPVSLPCRAIVGGDASVRSISAASILAKTARDAHMCELHAMRLEYGFDKHKGYSTPEHLSALRAHGVCEFHRKTFAPVRELLVQRTLF